MIFKTLLLCFSLLLVHGQETSEESDDPKLQIVNGRVADRDEATFAVFILQQYEIDGIKKADQCTGSLIDRRTVLTAAHCVYQATLENSNGKVKIRYGAHDLRFSSFEDIPAEKLIVHKGYDGNDPESNDDIAIIKLERPVKKHKKRVSFVKLPKRKKYDYEAGTKATAYGWGDTTRDNRKILPAGLLKTTLKIVTDDPDIEEDKDENSIYARNKKSAICHGDSGGPLVIHKNVLIGVLSGALTSEDQKFECEPNTISQYTKVESYLKWIKKNRK